MKEQEWEDREGERKKEKMEGRAEGKGVQEAEEEWHVCILHSISVE